jgi:hypothetical protein
MPTDSGLAVADFHALNGLTPAYSSVKTAIGQDAQLPLIGPRLIKNLDVDARTAAHTHDITGLEVPVQDGQNTVVVAVGSAGAFTS